MSVRVSSVASADTDALEKAERKHMFPGAKILDATTKKYMKTNIKVCK